MEEQPIGRNGAEKRREIDRGRFYVETNNFECVTIRVRDQSRDKGNRSGDSKAEA